MARSIPIHIDRLEAGETPTFLIERFVDNRIDGRFERPHRHDFQEILWIQAGRGTHRVDGLTGILGPQTLALIVKGQVHNFVEASGFTGYLIRFADDFLHDPQGATWDHTALFHAMRGTHALHVPRTEADEIDAFCALMAGEAAQTGAFGKAALLRHLLHALLIKIERLNRLAPSDGELESAAGYALYRAFTGLLEQHFPAHHDVQYYADTLAVSAPRLSRVLQEVTGMPAKRLIMQRILLEGQRLLQFTPLTVGEIADTLGYADQFHFSKLFKQQTGITPQRYREARQ
jgi:AraC family transcriptional activator of pobA